MIVYTFISRFHLNYIMRSNMLTPVITMEYFLYTHKWYCQNLIGLKDFSFSNAFISSLAMSGKGPDYVYGKRPLLSIPLVM